jgi:hypothetical protein
MTDFTTLSNPSVAVGGIPSGATVTALRDNPIAISEGTTGAPKILSRALGIATGSATITTGVSVFTSLDGAATIAVASEVTLSIASSSAAASASSRYRLSNDGGGSYGSYVTLLVADVPATTTQPEADKESNVIAVDVSTFNAIEFSCPIVTGSPSRSLKVVFWAVQGET